jgi:hypothetical protein
MDPILGMPFNPLLGNFDFSSRLLVLLSGSLEQFLLFFPIYQLGMTQKI